MVRFFFSLSLFAATIICSLSADMGPQGFAAYPNTHFIATGIRQKETIRKAIRAQFPVIHALETNPRYLAESRAIYLKHSEVHIWNKNSATQLWDVIFRINKTITFWLDGRTPVIVPKSGQNSFLMQELEQIRRHPIKTHTILIDDRHVMGTAHFDGITEQQIIQKLYEINPNYTISYDIGGGSGEHPGNVLVASIR